MAGPISVPVAIVLGLLSSFIQSLGLTIQRKSHLQNAALPEWKQRSEWKRPLWLIGFAVFIVANIGGTVFQIGALPIVMLAPLGAVSLLYNALLARFILNDFFSRYMVMGTLLIAVGAVLIGYFGVVEEPTHSLDDLLALYARPPFIAFASVFVLAFVGVLALVSHCWAVAQDGFDGPVISLTTRIPQSHLAEWQLHVRLFRPQSHQDKGKGNKSGKRRKPNRRWSAPSLAPLVEVSESSSGIATPVLEIADEAARRGIPVDRVLPRGNGSLTLPRSLKHGSRDYGSIPRHANAPLTSPSGSSGGGTPLDTALPDATRSTSAAAAAAAVHDPAIRRTCLGLAVAYGGASGTLSGACLLLAKSGVELLVLTIGGDNQFDRWQSWFLVVIMFSIAILQLWYLNKSLRLADPTLVCPLAFCFYNTSSIMLGLVYFNQLGSLSAVSLTLVVIGIVVLLAGVWTVSLHGSAPGVEDLKEEEQGLLEHADTSNLSPTTVMSPTEIDNATERDALLANAGGIGGPHLPPPTSAATGTMTSAASSSTLVTSPNTPFSPPQSQPMSPNSTSSSMKGSRRARARSGSGTLIAGLGMHVPGLPVQNVRFGDDEADVVDIETPTSPTSGSKPTHRRRASDGSASPSPTLQRRRPLYESLLERGLSIGISPSSPGFHLKQSFEEEQAAALNTALRERDLRQHPRRTLSEADVESVVANVAAGIADELQQNGPDFTDGEEAEGGSAWNRIIPALDYNILSDRLTKLSENTRGWFGGVFTKKPDRGGQL